jgi:hypothetical protein
VSVEGVGENGGMSEEVGRPTTSVLSFEHLFTLRKLWMALRESPSMTR